MPIVALTRGSRSYDAVRAALELVRQDVKLPTDRPILVKPNLVQNDFELCATPVEAVRATLDFLHSLGAQRFIIGEATAGPAGDTMTGFKNYGYLPLADKYDVQFKNLNDDDHVVFEALDQDLKPVKIRLAKTFFQSYVVSVARMKTHSQVIATLSIKNIAISAIHNPDRHSWAWHPHEPGVFSHEPGPLNLYLTRLYQTIRPGLAIVDGVIGMERNGPVTGTPIASGIALASANPLALDMVGAGLMGFDWRTLGYLWYLSQIEGLDRDAIKVVGEDPAPCVTRYLPHDNMPWMLGWWVNNWREYIRESYLLKE